MVPLEVDSLADSGVYTIEFNVESENEFSDLVSEEEDVKKVSFTLQFKLWQGYGSEELTVIDYGDLYFYCTAISDDFLVCYSDGERYCIDFDNLELGTYEYSLIIWYKDEELPDEDTIWNYKVNASDSSSTSGLDAVFTIDENTIESAQEDDRAYIECNVNNTLGTLESILPFRLTNYTFTFTLYSTGSTIATCPDYGNLYLIGNYHQEDDWNDYELLTYNENNGTYSVTVPEVYPGTFAYNILFVYDDEDGPSSSSWTHALFEGDQTYTIEKEQGNGYEATITHTLGFELGTKFAEHGDALTNYTLRFTIWTSYDNANQGRDYSTYGYNVYIIGSHSSSNWATAEICIYNYHYSEKYGEEVVSFDFTTNNVFQPGETYTYKLLYTNTTVASYTEDWSNPEITGNDQTLTIPSDAQNDEILEIEIYSDFWFDNPSYPS